VDVLSLLRLLADDNRLRLLTLLEQDELSVQELTRATGLGQSRVSHHLGLLRQAGVINDRREGSFTFCRLQLGLDGNPLTQDLWKQVGTPFSQSDVADADRRRLYELREERKAHQRAAHDQLAGIWGGVGEDLERDSLRIEALSALAPRERVVADLGCGAGFFTRLLADRFDRVIAVDHSKAMLEAARQSLRDVTVVDWRSGDLESLPLEDAEVDAVFTNLVLHRVLDVTVVAREFARVLKSGGTVIITDFAPHNEEWMREELAAERLGVEAAEVASALQSAGFENVEEMAIRDRYRMKSTSGRVARLDLFLVRGTKIAV